MIKEVEEMIKQDKEDFCEAILHDTDVMLSCFLLDNLNEIRFSWDIVMDEDIRFKVNREKLKSFAKFLDCIIYRLGDIEHSSDWDPFLAIDIEGESLKMFTPSHYYMFEVREKTIEIEAPTWEDIREWYNTPEDVGDLLLFQKYYSGGRFSIPIKSINSISLER